MTQVEPRPCFSIVNVALYSYALALFIISDTAPNGLSFSLSRF